MRSAILSLGGCTGIHCAGTTRAHSLLPLLLHALGTLMLAHRAVGTCPDPICSISSFTALRRLPSFTPVTVLTLFMLR